MFIKSWKELKDFEKNTGRQINCELIVTLDLNVVKATGGFKIFEGLSPESLRLKLSKVLRIPVFHLEKNLWANNQEYDMLCLWPTERRRQMVKIKIDSFIEDGTPFTRFSSRFELTSNKHVAENFVILSTPRSGSTHLLKLLNQHPQIICLEELFIDSDISLTNPEYYQGFWRSTLYRRFKHLFFRPHSVKDFLKTYSATCDQFGFKLMVSQYEQYPWLFEHLSDHRTSVISIRRKNILKQFVSLLAAQSTGIWHIDKRSKPFQSIYLSPKNFINNLTGLSKEIQRQDKLATQLGAMRVYYEDLEANQQQVMDSIFIHLGLNKISGMRSPLTKILPKTLRDTIQNYDEIAAIVRGTPFERDLYDEK